MCSTIQLISYQQSVVGNILDDFIRNEKTTASIIQYSTVSIENQFSIT